MAPDGVVVTCEDEPNLSRLPLSRRRVRYGWAGHAAWRLERYVPRLGGGATLTIRRPDGEHVSYEIVLSGRHNAANAAGAIAICRELGVDGVSVRQGLASFQGTGRRFETVARTNEVWVVDDYAHHPTELTVNLEAARDVHGGRLVAVFQPHTTHRTLALLDDFARAFSAADRVILAPIYQPAGRTGDAPAEITSEQLAARIEHPDVIVAPTLDATYALAEAELRPGTLVLVAGAGNITTVARRLGQRVTSQTAPASARAVASTGAPR
jgi:UDP-N-acetylmuramate--alanine ligase